MSRDLPLHEELTHEKIWGAIDALAKRENVSVSRLAVLAGLDPTTFNNSKRYYPDGRERWPTTRSLARILTATNTPISDIAGLAEY